VIRFATDKNARNARLWGLSCLCVAILTVSCSATSWALDDEIGTIKLSRFLLEPTFAWRDPDTFDRTTSETRRTGFGLQQYQLAARWENDTAITGHFAMGSLLNLNRTRETTGVPPSSMGVIEGYAQWQAPVGQVRAGLIPIFYGLEGQLLEADLDFPRSLFFQLRYMPLRDYGVSYSLRHENFHSQFSVHNGESAEDLDGRQAATGVWGWTGPAGVHAGVSGHLSRPINVATNQDARVRFGNAYLGFQVYGSGIWMEGNLGDRRESSSGVEVTTPVSHFHIDALAKVWKDFGFQARFDELDPNRDLAGDRVREMTVGLSWHNTTRTQHLYLLAIKRTEESIERLNDELRLVWRINSAQNRFPSIADRFE
jgi:hypothetical protein